MIRSGKIVEAGSYEQVMNAKQDLYNLIVEFGKRAEEVRDEDTDNSELTLVSNITDSSAVVSDEDNDLIENESVKAPTLKETTLRRASLASFHRGKLSAKATDEERARLTGQKKEHMEQGKVKWNVYNEYAKACSYSGIIIHILFVIGSQAAAVGMFPSKV